MLTMRSDIQPHDGAPTRIFIAGGCYAGISTALNLLDLCEGGLPRCNPALERDTTRTYSAPIEITIVDERDGYCEYKFVLTKAAY